MTRAAVAKSGMASVTQSTMVTRNNPNIRCPIGESPGKLNNPREGETDSRKQHSRFLKEGQRLVEYLLGRLLLRHGAFAPFSRENGQVDGFSHNPSGKATGGLSRLSLRVP